MIVIIMGVAGSGKTRVGSLLAKCLDWPFFDGDDFHPQENIIKMSQGISLTDQDRFSWLASLEHLIEILLVEGKSAVLACSALKQAYRNQLRIDPQRIFFFYLKADPSLIQHRLEQRPGHFMKPEMTESQFRTLEEPADASIFAAEASPKILVDEMLAIIAQLAKKQIF
jgi:gluconokinase